MPAIARLASRLRAEPPGPGGAGGDPGGDHVLDAAWTRQPGVAAPKPAAVLVGLVNRPEPTVILTRRSTALRRHSGQIAFPGGRMDPSDPSPLAAALREAEEEIGLDRALVRPLGYLDAYLSGSGYLVVPVVAQVEPGFELRLNPFEVDEAFEVPLAFLMDESNHELHAREWNGRIRQYHAMPYERHYIWGVTAGILRNLFERYHQP
ncbi:CoA pyrophosphatase [Salinarimonas soli]|uniref:CoA pyrophosphatase n=1 Tax=Salinarimonas soli TaxID=1638099 RepID=A0A5B2VA60_9HYPH|nr:CoA pyrophosphatase [Salinarimonas soli]KAA2236403.1 CoA pyrophosphatase [Salinarimonas soli]